MTGPSYDEFTVAFDEESVAELRRRLRQARWPAPGSEVPRDAGTDARALHEVVTAWSEFDVQACAQSINEFHHVRVTVDGELIHAVHERGKGPRPFPIVLTHGWPSTFWEYSALIPLLTDPAAHGGDPEDAFDVIAPSLPGFGFSEAPARTDFADADVADRWARLVVDGIGYQRFGAHGTDIGARVTARLARQHPEHLVGIHLAALGLPPPSSAPSAEEAAYVRAGAAWRDEEGAYIHIQSTRPRTLGYALTDSPIGLAAWFLEKYQAWSDGRGQSLSGVPLEWILTTLTIYWMTATITSSFQPYYSSRRTPTLTEVDRVEVPTGVALFPHEHTRIPSPPRSLAERHFNVARWNEFSAGGHFPAAEQPSVLANDIREFFRPLRDGDKHRAPASGPPAILASGRAIGSG